MINRRSFLISILSMLFGAQKAYSTVFEGLVKRPQDGYYPILLARLFGWYNQEYFNFTKEFSKQELEYIASVFRKSHHLRWHSKDDTAYKKLFWSARLTNGTVYYSRLTLGFEPGDYELRALAQKVINQKHIKNFAGLSLDEICGLGWDFGQKTFKIYFFSEKEKLNTYLTDIKSIPGKEQIPQQAVASLKFQGSTLLEKRLCIPVQKFLTTEQKELVFNPEMAQQIMGHYSNLRDAIYIPDYLGINVMRLPPPLKYFCQSIMDNFATGPTSGIINHAANMILYYP